MKNSNDEENEKLRKLNEEKKREIEAEFGAAIWGKSENNDLPPEIENQFLNNILNYERRFKDAKKISVFDFLGKPSFKKEEDLNDKELHLELERIFEIMQNNNVTLDTICEVPDRELYRFITEEFFVSEIEDMRIPGMNCCFIYEDFHPNHEHDIRRNTEDFLRSYFDKSSEFYKNLLTSNAEKQDWHQQFRNAFKAFDLVSFKIIDLSFDEKDANVKFKCNIDANIEGANEKFIFKGEGEITLKYEWDYWSIESIRLPKSKVL